MKQNDESKTAGDVRSSDWLAAQVGRRVRQRINGKLFVITGFSRSPNSGKARFHLFYKRARRLILAETVVKRWLWDTMATNIEAEPRAQQNNESKGN